LYRAWKQSSYGSQLDFIRSFHEKPLDAIREYQLDTIKKLVKHAYNNVPFYFDEWNKIGLKPEDIRSFEDFNRIPLLTKEKIRKNMDKLLRRNIDKDLLIKSGTGGTTDSPIIIYYNSNRAKLKEAEMHYFREWFSWNMGDKVAYLWGAPQDIPDLDSIKYSIVNRLTFNKLHLFTSLMNRERMMEFADRINRFKPDILQAYSNPAHIFSRFILENGIKIHSPKSIVLTAEPCHNSQRKIIEEAFRCKVFSFYGCREGGYVGVECNRHSGYHINCSGIYTEVMKGGEKAKAGELGNIVFTDLFNYDMPFIRYQIGDMGVMRDAPCQCGSPLPLMELLAGRETDVFVTPDGSFVPGVSLCDRIIEDCEGIEQLQFIQNEIDALQVKIVKGPGYSDKDIAQLDSRLDNYFHGRLRIEKIFVDDIPKEKSGKTRFCISNISKSDKA
jgi:phenylacetate-CoA ligase